MAQSSICASARRPIRFLCVVITFALLADIKLSALELEAGEFMAVHEVERGMRGYGLTVFEGTRIDTFSFEVLGVERGSWPQQDLIWGRMAGGPLEKTGIIAGMSGSPVYVDGKLLGAVAYGWGTAKEPLCGLTPIHEMLSVLERQERDPPKGRDQAGALWDLPDDPAKFGTAPRVSTHYPLAVPSRSHGSVVSQLAPVATPLMVSGFGAEIFDLMAPEFEHLGFAPSEGGGNGRSARVPPRLEPGSAVGVQLVRGDMSVQSFGTLTYRRGDDIVAFGHPMRSLGRVAMPMTTMDVHFVVPNMFMSFKFGSAIEVVGTIAQDRSSAIAGRIGPQPSMIPVTARVGSDAGDRQFNYEVVDDRHWTPGLFWYAVAATIGASTKVNGEHTIDTQVEITLSGRDQSLTAGNLFASTRAVYETSTYVTSILSQLHDNSFEDVRVEHVDLKIALREQIDSAAIESLRLDRNEVRPGTALAVAIGLQRRHGGTEELEAIIDLPKELEDGIYEVRVYDSRMAIMIARQRSPLRWRPATVAHLAALIEEYPRNDELVVALLSRRPGATVGAVELAALPPSRLAVMSSSRHSGEVALTQVSMVSKQMIRAGSAVSGQHMLPIRIDRSAR